MKTQIITLFSLLLAGGLSAQTFTNYTTVDGLLNDNVICVDVDASDNIWFGTQDGVSVFDGTNWTSHTTATDPGLAANTIQAIYVASNGDVWVGTDFGASVYTGGSWTTYTTVDGLGNDQVKCISEDLAGDIWFGTNTGATEFTGSTWTTYGTTEGLPFGGVVTIDTHSNGDIYMGSGLGGLIVFDGTNFTIYTTADGLIDDRVRGFVHDGQNNKWVGTSEGITVLDASNTPLAYHTIIFTLPPPDTLNPIEDVEMDSQGNIWVGVYVDYLVTEGGVCAYNGNQWVEYHVADGLVGPVVRALAIDGNDDVWVATSTGVSKISDHNVAVAEVQADEFMIFPNPASATVNIKFETAVNSNSLSVFNTSMQLVKTVEFSGNSASFDVDDLTSGVYFVQCNNRTERLMIH